MVPKRRCTCQDHHNDYNNLCKKNQSLPTSKVYMTTPQAQASTSKLYPSHSLRSHMPASNTSGAKYPGVPTHSYNLSAPVISLAKPKSVNLTLLCSSNKMFSGLISLCSTFFWKDKLIKIKRSMTVFKRNYFVTMMDSLEDLLHDGTTTFFWQGHICAQVLKQVVVLT